MGLGLFLVPLIGGYLFLRFCNYTRFSVGRESGLPFLVRGDAGRWC